MPAESFLEMKLTADAASHDRRLSFRARALSLAQRDADRRWPIDVRWRLCL